MVANPLDRRYQVGADITGSSGYTGLHALLPLIAEAKRRGYGGDASKWADSVLLDQAVAAIQGRQHGNWIDEHPANLSAAQLGSLAAFLHEAPYGSGNARQARFGEQRAQALRAMVVKQALSRGARARYLQDQLRALPPGVHI